MNQKDKINYAKDFFAGKDPEIHPMFVKPTKALYWYPDKPELHFDPPGEESKSYTEDEVEELGRKFFLMIIKILKTPEEVAFAKEWKKRKNDRREATTENHP